MALYNFKHAGIYGFKSYAHPEYALNAYTSDTAKNGTNLCLFPFSSGDTAQQWRIVYAGNEENHCRRLEPKTHQQMKFTLNMI